MEIIEVIGKDISKECSCCGSMGQKKDSIFICPSCGYQVDEKINAAQNAKKRGQGERRLY